MNQSAITHLDNVLAKRLSFEIGPTLSRGIEIWKKDIGSFIGFGLLYMIISSMCNFVPLVGPIAASILVTPALSVGAAMYAHKLHTNSPVSFNDFFDGFQYWKDLAIVGLCTFAAALVLIIPVILFVGLGAFTALADPLAATDFNFDPSPIFIGFFILLMIVFMYFAICIAFAPHFVAFYGLDAVTSIKYSFRFVNANWIWVFLFFIVAGIISMLGFIALFIGIFVTYPMLFAFQFSSFEELTEYVAYENRANEKDSVNIDDMFR